MLTVEFIQQAIETGLPDSRVEVRDRTGSQDHFEVMVVSSAFDGKSLVERHRMVYGVVWPASGGQIHALALRTLTPAEAKE
jgi:stress-induced morphogen